MGSAGAAPGSRGTRAERVAIARKLRGEGLLVREIAERMGVARTTASEYLSDPDLSKHRRRRYEHAGSCADCGAPTDASYGAPAKRCAECNKRILVESAKERGRRHRELVERLWAEGKTVREIRAITGRVINITTSRRAGYNLPYRYPGWRIAKARVGTAESMAHARAARSRNGDHPAPASTENQGERASAAPSKP